MKLLETAINQQGESYIYSQTEVQSWQIPGHVISELFHGSHCPPDMLQGSDPIPNQNFDLKPGEVKFLKTDIYPTRATYNEFPEHNTIPLKKFFYHSTPTVDFVVVVKGEVTMIVGNEAVSLKEGDCVIQRGAAHAWHNYTHDVATIAVVMLGVNPPPHFQHIKQ